MNNYDAKNLNHTPFLFSQSVDEALKKLHIKTSLHDLHRVYVYDLIEQYTIYDNCSIATLLGYPIDEIETLISCGLEHLIHPDDLGRVSSHFQRLNTLRAEDVIMLEYRMWQADGTWCWLCSVETPLTIARDGFPLQILGVVWVVVPFSMPTLNVLNTIWQRNPPDRTSFHLVKDSS